MIVNGLWVGEKLTLMEYSSIKSYMDLGYEYHLHTYNKIKNVPEGCIIKDANKTILEADLFNEKNSILPFSDLWRFMYIYKNGGIWVDLDMIALKRFDDLLTNDLIFSSQRAMLSGAFKSSQEVEPALSFIYAKNKENIHLLNLFNLLYKKKGKMRNCAEGMRVIKHYIRKHNDNIRILHPADMTNIDWWHSRELFMDLDFKKKWGVEPNIPLIQGYAVHLWRNKFRELQKTKNLEFDEPVVASLYDNLTEKYADEYSQNIKYNYNH